jgi:hypothetical protein
MSETEAKVCPVCGVKILPIIGGDRVLFSSGPPGTRETLWNKVCQYAQKPACINQAKDRLPPA